MMYTFCANIQGDDRTTREFYHRKIPINIKPETSSINLYFCYFKLKLKHTYSKTV